MKGDTQKEWEEAGAGPILAAKLSELEAEADADRSWRHGRQARMEKRLRETATLDRIRELAHALADVTVAYDRLGEQAGSHIASIAISESMRSLCDRIKKDVRVLDAGDDR